MKRVDVVVAGGGLAGGVAAAELATHGFSVRMAERKADPGDFNYCAEAVSLRSMARFEVLTDDLISAPIDGGILGGPDGERVTLHWPKVGAILHRDQLMRRVFDGAIEAGAEGVLRTDVVDVERDRTGRLAGVRVSTPTGESVWPCDAVVAADGVASVVGRRGGIDTGLQVGELYSCAQYRVTDADVQVGFPEFWIGDVHAPGGYAWVFPRGPREANLGIAIVADRPSAAGQTATHWLKRFRKYRFPNGCKIESYITGGIPVLVRPSATAAQGILLAGDAARSADPLSAAGIAEAMASGRVAAQTLAAALGDGDLSAGRLAMGERVYRAEHPRLKVMARIRRVFDRLSDPEKRKLVAACGRAFGDRRIDDIDPLQMFTRLLSMSPSLLPMTRHLLAAHR